MATFWSTSFAFPNQIPTYNPWSYNGQGVNYPVAWPLACHSQYHQQPRSAVIQSVDSESSSSSEDEEDQPKSPTTANRRRPTSAKGKEKPRPSTSGQASEKGPTSSPRTQPGPSKSPKTSSSAAPLSSPQAPTSPSRNQLVASPKPTQLGRSKSLHVPQHATHDLRQFIHQSPTTFAAMSMAAFKRERPMNWRPDYLPPSASWIKRRVKGVRTFLSDEATYFDPRTLSLITRPNLNPILRYPSPPPSTYFYDLRCNPFSAYLLHLPNSNGPVNHVHLLQVGLTPASHDLRLWHPKLPWTIIVRSTHSNGILVSDILGNIYTQLMTPIGSGDYYNEVMTADDRERVETAYKARCNGDIGLLRLGILRVDFLGADVGFVGLSRSWNGMWEIRTVDINDVEKEV